MSIQFTPTGAVEVPEIRFEEEVAAPALKTALIVVDMQNDFVKPGGSLVVESAAQTVPRIGSLLERARQKGVRVAYTQDTHFQGDREWEIWPEHCRSGTWGWQIIEELEPAPQDVVCQKNRYDGFYGTWLDHFLRVWGVDHLILTGTVSNICVLHTAASAGLRWLRLVVPADGVSALTDFDQAASLRQISWLYSGAVTRSVDDVRFVE